MRFVVLFTIIFSLISTSAHAAKDPIKVGIGDQNVSMFHSPHYQKLELKEVRYFVRWDVLHEPYYLNLVTDWVNHAKASGANPLIHIGTTSYDGKAKLPSLKRYKKEMGALVPYLMSIGVRDFGTWNEANHWTQPTYRNPKRTADFFKAMYNTVHKTNKCSTKKCRVIALDILDQGGATKYMDKFYKSLNKTWRKRAKIVGIHNYVDVNRGTGRNTKKIISTSRKYNKKSKFWFTETGGFVKFSNTYKCSEKRAANRISKTFRIAKRHRRQGVQRVYLYNWTGTNCKTKFDTGLVDVKGNPRPGYYQVVKLLKTFSK